MNNSGALYIAHTDHAVVAEALARRMAAGGYTRAELAPDDLSGRIMIPNKPTRHFLVVPAASGWVTVWEDPRYFADRDLARGLAEDLATRAIWIEVGGNGVSWARGLYEGDRTIDERFDEVTTTFYGEYGVVRLTFDVETTPDEFVAGHGLPYDELHYEAALQGELPPEAGAPTHLAFMRGPGRP